MSDGLASYPPVETRVSATTPDWSREVVGRLDWNPPRQLLRSIRDYARAVARGNELQRRAAVARHRFWSVVTGADIPVNANIAGGLLMPHPTGIVIHPGAVIGPNCLIFQHVTIGAGSLPGLPVLEGHVDIGAGARILGGITLGAHCRVGANAVVTRDVPRGATVAGIPARIIQPRGTRTSTAPQAWGDEPPMPSGQSVLPGADSFPPAFDSVPPRPADVEPPAFELRRRDSHGPGARPQPPIVRTDDASGGQGRRDRPSQVSFKAVRLDDEDFDDAYSEPQAGGA